MAVQVTRLSGDDWQEWATHLLTRRYGPTEYQKVPDNQKGDAGIEGFSRCGHTYQCYGCQEPISSKDRYEAQRDKLTEDIGKFIKNKDKLKPIFGTVKITRWVLFVPFFDSKDLVSHAAKKTPDVIAANLAYVEQGFQVVICDEDQFRAERDFLLNARDESLKLSCTDATPTQIQEWSDGNDELVRKLDDKLRRLNTLKTPDSRSVFREKILGWYLEGQELLASLRSYPQTYEKVIAAKAHREKGLTVASLTHEGTAAELLNCTLRELKEDLRSTAKELSAASAESLTREAVSDWLLRCPLDFPR